MNKVQTEYSLKINQKYIELTNQRSILLKNKEDLELSKKEQQRLNKLEKEIIKVRNACKRNLLKTIKTGENIIGSLEKELTLTDEKIKNSISKWARKRGYGFEKWFGDLLNKYALDRNLKMLCYRNFSSKFGFQPYDLVLYRANDVPIFIECKASGIIENSKGVKVQACFRRYTNYTNKVQRERLEDFYLRAGAIMFFVFREESSKYIYFVDARLILVNAEWLCKKQIPLTQDMYYKIPYDVDQWPVDIDKKLVAYARDLKIHKYEEAQIIQSTI